MQEALEQTLKDLQTDYVDLYLVRCFASPPAVMSDDRASHKQIHWPISFEYSPDTFVPLDQTTNRIRLGDVPLADTWAALEKLTASGKIRSIGVSNFTRSRIEDVLRTAKIPPAVNQIEAHPFLQQRGLLEFMREKVGCPTFWDIDDGGCMLFRASSLLRIVLSRISTPNQGT